MWYYTIMTEPVATAPASAASSVSDSFAAGYQQGMNPPPPKPVKAPTAAAPAASGVAGAATTIASKIGDAANAGADAVNAAVQDPSGTLDKAEKAGKGFFDNLNPGKIIGGILGLAGAWLLGSFFGEGILSTVLMVCLAFPLMIMGSDKLGSTINGWMGHKSPDEPQVALAPQVGGPQQAVAKNQQANAATPATPAKMSLSEAEMNAMLDAAKQKHVQTNSITLVKQNDKLVPVILEPTTAEVNAAQIPVQKMRDVFAECKRATGSDQAITFSPIEGRTDVTPSCVPIVAAANSPGRAS